MRGRALVLVALLSAAVPVTASPRASLRVRNCTGSPTGMELVGAKIDLSTKSCSGTWSGFRCIGLSANCSP